MTKKIKILTVFGTRPEVIKLAPFIKLVEADKSCIGITCATTQHKEMQNDVLGLFGIEVDYDLNIMRDAQDLLYITNTVMTRVHSLLLVENPDVVIVQGDTTTAFSAALASFYCRIPVVHIEAGLRTGNIHRPYPEEANRCMISNIASLHIAPTQVALDNLVKEGITKNVFKLGNTIIDAVTWVLQHFTAREGIVAELMDTSMKIVLITVHRRENFGESLVDICMSIRELTEKYSDYLFVWPVHPNPNIHQYVHANMAEIANLRLCPPVSYAELIHLLDTAALVLTDSGGIQEECCILGKRVLILRKETERPEVVKVGIGFLCGSDKHDIITYFDQLVNTSQAAGKTNIYGKPGVSKRILWKMFANMVKNEKYMPVVS